MSTAALCTVDWPGPLIVTGKEHTQLLMQLRDPRTQAEGYIHFCSLRGAPSPMNPQGCELIIFARSWDAIVGECVERCQGGGDADEMCFQLHWLLEAPARPVPHIRPMPPPVPAQRAQGQKRAGRAERAAQKFPRH